MSASCRSCGAPLLWARTSGRRWLPLDAEPVADHSRGTLFVLRELADPKPLAVAVPPASMPGGLLYRAHFVSCPHADKWRSAKRRAEREQGRRL